MSKFEIGSQWKTRGGWRAVVVDDKLNTQDPLYPVNVWHSGGDEEETMRHTASGLTFASRDNDEYEMWPEGRNYDLIEPWKELREFEVVIDLDRNGQPLAYLAQDYTSSVVISNPIATKRITIKEGEFIDGQ